MGKSQSNTLKIFRHFTVCRISTAKAANRLRGLARIEMLCLPYYAKPSFNWDDRKNWINDQNAVNYWIKNIKQSQYPTDFSGKSY